EVGVTIVRLEDSAKNAKVLYRNKSDTPLIPASNLKLVTTAAALDVLGKDFRFQTLVATRGEDLHIWADGDPTIGDTELLQKVGWGSTTTFEHWAEALKQRGITRVRNVVLDDGIFDMQFVHPNWPENQI